MKLLTRSVEKRRKKVDRRLAKIRDIIQRVDQGVEASGWTHDAADQLNEVWDLINRTRRECLDRIQAALRIAEAKSDKSPTIQRRYWSFMNSSDVFHDQAQVMAVTSRRCIESCRGRDDRKTSVDQRLF